MTQVDSRLTDARNLLYLVWQHCGLPEPTELQYSIMDYLQHGPKRAVVQAARGFGKSWITSVLILHALLLDPEKRVLLVSASKARADDTSVFLRRCISEIPVLQHLKPKEDQRDTRNAWDVGGASAAHAPSVRSIGATSSLLQGSRSDLIVADDVESLMNSITAGGRARLSTNVKEFDAILTDRPDSRILFLGTPQIEESLYHSLAQERGYSLRVWPARKPTPEEEGLYGGNLAPYITDLEVEPGEPTEPSRFDAFELEAREASYGRTGFQMQFMLNPRLADREQRPLRLSDLVVMDLDDDLAPERVIYASGPDQKIDDLPCVGLSGDAFHRPMTVQGDHVAYETKIVAIDPSGRGQDECAAVALGVLNSQIFLLDAIGMRSGFEDETLERLARMCERFKPHTVVVEENFSGGMFTQLLKPVLFERHKCSVEEVRVQSNKMLRICDTLEPVLSSHRMIVGRSVIRNDFDSTQLYDSDKAHCYQLFWQMARVTRHKNCLLHDDRIDCLSLGVGWLADRMDRDIETSVKRRQEQRFQRELDEFMSSMGGNKDEGPLWMRVGGKA